MAFFFQSYISCTLGVANVGYIFICYGVVDAICSISFGSLVNVVGHIPFFILGKTMAIPLRHASLLCINFTLGLSLHSPLICEVITSVAIFLLHFITFFFFLE